MFPNLLHTPILEKPVQGVQYVPDVGLFNNNAPVQWHCRNLGLLTMNIVTNIVLCLPLSAVFHTFQTCRSTKKVFAVLQDFVTQKHNVLFRYVYFFRLCSARVHFALFFKWTYVTFRQNCWFSSAAASNTSTKAVQPADTCSLPCLCTLAVL